MELKRIGSCRRVGAAGALLIAVLFGPGKVSAQQTPADSSERHVVRRGDTLWDLARLYLNDPFRWPEIYAINRDVVRDPHWIYPQDRLLIPGRMGLVLPPMGILPAAGGAVSGEIGRTVFFGEGPGGVDPRTLRLTPPEEITVVESGAYFRAGLLLREADIVPLGQLVDVISPTVVPRRGTPQIHPYEQVLMRVEGAVEVGERVHLLRVSRNVPPYGRLLVPTGSAVVLAVHAGTATIEVDQLYDRVDIGDIALRMPEYRSRPGVFPQASGGLEGRLLAFIEPQPIVATGDVAFVDLGSASGVVEGDEFVALVPAVQESWGFRPEVEVARLQVVRAGGVTSAVRVISLQHPALVEGMPVRLVGKMPAPSD